MSVAVVVVPPRGGEIIGDSDDRRVEVLSDHDALHATWTRFAPGRDGADLHVHRRHSDLFYVLAGELTVRLGPEGREVRLPPGTLARIPALVVHGFRNGGDAELRHLNFHAPGCGFIGYLRSLRDGVPYSYDQFEPPEDGGRPVDGAVFGRPAELDDAAGIAVAEVELEPGRGREAGAPDALESAYVITGEATLTADGETIAAPAGTWLQVPAGVERAWSADAPARLLVVRTPTAR